MPHSSKQGNYHHGDLRRSVIDTALAIVTELGIPSLTFREIASRIGVSRMAPYRHFENKAELLAVLAQEGFQALYEYVQAARSQAADRPLMQLQAIGVAYILYAVENPVRYRVMFDPALSDRTIYPPLYQTAVQNFDCLLQVLSECQATGAIRAGDPKQLAQINWSLFHGLATLSIDRQFSTMGSAPIAELANAAVTTLIRGLQDAP